MKSRAFARFFSARVLDATPQQKPSRTGFMAKNAQNSAESPENRQGLSDSYLQKNTGKIDDSLQKPLQKRC
jgi:hypothetical protein